MAPPSPSPDAVPLPGAPGSLEGDGRASRRSVALTVGVALVLLAAVGLTNVLVDPQAEWGTGLLPPRVFRHRELRVAKLRSPFFPPPEVLVLGSSRAWKVEPGWVEDALGGRTLVAAVDDGRAEDHLALLRFALREVEAPLRVVLLQLDVPAFHPDHPTEPQLLRDPHLGPHLPDDVPLVDRLAPYLDALGLPRFQESLGSLRLALTGYPTPDVTVDDQGFLTYVEREARIRQGTFDLDHHVQATAAHHAELLAGVTRLSPRRLAYLDALLDLAGEAGVRVLAWVPPTHPDQVEHLRSRTRFVELREELIKELERRARRGRLVFLDATDLDALGAAPEDFYDGIHPREETNRKILLRLFEKEPGLALQ